jgi:hypothetical protein
MMVKINVRIILLRQDLIPETFSSRKKKVRVATGYPTK